MPEVTSRNGQGMVQPPFGTREWAEEYRRVHGIAPMAGAEAPAGAPPASAQPTQGAEGEGQGQATAGAEGSEGGFNWGNFPDVPEDQHETLEPHLRNVQGHVTRMEQQVAAFKPLIDQNLPPEDIASLANFSEAISRDPVGTWLSIAEEMQKAGVIHGDLDLDAVTQIAKSGDIGEGGTGAEGGEGGEGGADPMVAQLTNRIEQLEGNLSARDQQALEAQQMAALGQALGDMRAQLTEAGVPEDVLTDETLNASIIAHNGDTTKAIESIKGFRDSTLKGFADKRGNGSKDLTLPKGAPSSPPRNKGSSRDPIRAARGEAEEFLKSQNQAAES